MAAPERFAETSDSSCTAGLVQRTDMSGVETIVLQNSFLRCVQNFAGALVRSLENYVEGHMINPIFNRQPS
jgi:hypothetical protein